MDVLRPVAERPAARAQSSFILRASSTAISGSFWFVLIPVLSIGISLPSSIQLLSVAEYSSCADFPGRFRGRIDFVGCSSAFLWLLSGNAIM